MCHASRLLRPSFDDVQDDVHIALKYIFDRRREVMVLFFDLLLVTTRYLDERKRSQCWRYDSAYVP